MRGGGGGWKKWGREDGVSGMGRMEKMGSVE